MADTRIEWCDKVWNPISGCSPISEGCENCYAARMSKRLAGRYGYPKDEPFRATLHEDKLEEPLRWKKPRMVFVCSMGDLFHPDVKDDWILAAFIAIGLCCKHTGEMKEVSPGYKVGIYQQRHTFIILTKRPQRMKDFIKRLLSNEPDEEWDKKARSYATFLSARNGDFLPDNAILTFLRWIQDGLPGLWLGVTAENQARADERIPILLQTPAAVRFVSVEPMLSEIKLARYLKWPICKHWKRDGNPNKYGKYHWEKQALVAADWNGMDWVICGGETGPGARPMHPDWARSLRDQCQAAGVPFFFKNWGEWGINCYLDDNMQKIPGSEWMDKMGKKRARRLLDGREWNDFPKVQ